MRFERGGGLRAFVCRQMVANRGGAGFPFRHNYIADISRKCATLQIGAMKERPRLLQREARAERLWTRLGDYLDTFVEGLG